MQVTENLESQRQQYELADLARSYGFRDVAVIDADLGVSASGTSDRLDFVILWDRSARGWWEQFSALRPLDWPATDGTGIICWSCVHW
jgi:hypothetical protein